MPQNFNPYQTYLHSRRFRGGDAAARKAHNRQLTRARRAAGAWLRTQPYATKYDYRSVFGKNTDSILSTLSGYTPPPTNTTPPPTDTTPPPTNTTPPGDTYTPIDSDGDGRNDDGNQGPGGSNPGGGNQPGGNVPTSLPSIFWPGMGQDNPGWMPQQTAYNPANQWANTVADRAVNGSIQSFDHAANRLRERLSAAQAGDMEQASAMNQSRGFGASGLNRASMQRVASAGQNAYAQGLVGLEDTFEKNRLQGLGIANESSRLIEEMDKNRASDIYNRQKQSSDILSDLFRNIYSTDANERLGRYSTDMGGIESIFRQISDMIRNGTGGGESSGSGGGGSNGFSGR